MQQTNPLFTPHIMGNPYDIASEIGDAGISRLLDMVCGAYKSLISCGTVTQSMYEDEITEELFNRLQLIWRESDCPFVPHCQKIDDSQAKVGKKPSIDFCFRDEWERHSYFGFECKRLIQGDAHLSNEYIKEGLCRYLDEKYCPFGSEGSLVGYIMQGAIDDIVCDIKKRVDNERMISPMVPSAVIDGFDQHYLSIHKRINGLSKFKIHHLFFCFQIGM